MEAIKMNATLNTRLRTQLLCFVYATFALSITVLEVLPSSGGSDTRGQTEIERARDWLAVYKYPFHVSAVESFNEELGKMKDGPMDMVNEQKFKDSFIVFDKRIITPLKSTRVFAFKICGMGPCGNNIVFVGSNTIFGLQSFYEMRDTTWRYVSRIEILVELLNKLFQLEEPEEFVADELLALITTVFTLEPSWVTILSHEDDVILPHRGEAQSMLTSEELKELEERYIQQERIRYAREGVDLVGLKEFGIEEPRFTTSQEGLQFTLYVDLPRMDAYRVVIGFVDRVFILKEKTASGIFSSSEND